MLTSQADQCARAPRFTRPGQPLFLRAGCVLPGPGTPAGQQRRPARRATCSAALGGGLAEALAAQASLAALHTEPANALSLPTWAIHVSSVTEWVLAMWLVWQYGDATGNARWKGLTWGMMPLLGGALAACTYHFFYNSPDLDFLVAIQAFLTLAGNFTLWWAAFRIYTASKEQAPS